jgi:hypothetical protein
MSFLSNINAINAINSSTSSSLIALSPPSNPPVSNAAKKFDFKERALENASTPVGKSRIKFVNPKDYVSESVFNTCNSVTHDPHSIRIIIEEQSHKFFLSPNKTYSKLIEPIRYIRKDPSTANRIKAFQLFAYNLFDLKNPKNKPDRVITEHIPSQIRMSAIINSHDLEDLEYKNGESMEPPMIPSTSATKLINFTSTNRSNRIHNKFVLDITYDKPEIKTVIENIFKKVKDLPLPIKVIIKPIPCKYIRIKLALNVFDTEKSKQDFLNAGFSPDSFIIENVTEDQDCYNPVGRYHHCPIFIIPSTSEPLLANDYFKQSHLQIFTQPAPFCWKCLKCNTTTTQCCGNNSNIPPLCFTCGIRESNHDFKACNINNKSLSHTQRIRLPCGLCNKNHHTTACPKAKCHWENYSFKHNQTVPNPKTDFPTLNVKNTVNNNISNNIGSLNYSKLSNIVDKLDSKSVPPSTNTTLVNNPPSVQTPVLPRLSISDDKSDKLEASIATLMAEMTKMSIQFQIQSDSILQLKLEVENLKLENRKLHLENENLKFIPQNFKETNNPSHGNHNSNFTVNVLDEATRSTFNNSITSPNPFSVLDPNSMLPDSISIADPPVNNMKRKSCKSHKTRHNNNNINNEL